MQMSDVKDKAQDLGGVQSMNSTQSLSGVRAIAMFEAAKGALVLIAGGGMLALLHRDLQVIAERVVRLAHLNPARKYPHIFLDAAARIDDAHLLWLAAAATLYATIRFVEAYGLWRGRGWAEWMAILSGGVYLPIEIYELARRPGALRLLVLIFNSGIVAYLLLYRRRKNQNGKNQNDKN